MGGTSRKLPTPRPHFVALTRAGRGDCLARRQNRLSLSVESVHPVGALTHRALHSVTTSRERDLHVPHHDAASTHAGTHSHDLCRVFHQNRHVRPVSAIHLPTDASWWVTAVVAAPSGTPPSYRPGASARTADITSGAIGVVLTAAAIGWVLTSRNVSFTPTPPTRNPPRIRGGAGFREAQWFPADRNRR